MSKLPYQPASAALSSRTGTWTPLDFSRASMLPSGLPWMDAAGVVSECLAGKVFTACVRRRVSIRPAVISNLRGTRATSADVGLKIPVLGDTRGASVGGSHLTGAAVARGSTSAEVLAPGDLKRRRLPELRSRVSTSRRLERSAS